MLSLGKKYYQFLHLYLKVINAYVGLDKQEVDQLICRGVI
jgi:hypothetical protein